jgi:hypothetical protein
MTDDPNKKAYPDPHQSPQQQDQGIEDIPRKKPTHDRPADEERDEHEQQQEDRQRQRQVS